jgi:putative PEP-CTERM system TPR-repeat lipoprotein
MRKLQAANPTNPEALDLLGQAQLQNGDKDGALDSYSKLVALAPKSGNAYMRLASVRAMMGNFSAAEDDLKRAVALDPTLVPARMGLAQLAMKRQKPDEALAIVRAIQALPGQNAAGLALEGELYLAQNKPVPALAALEKSYAQNANADVLLKIAVAMRQAGKGKEAEARLLKWQQANPADLAVPMYLAEQSMGEKQNALAISRFEAILKRFPDNVVALNNLAILYQQEKDARALPTARKAAAAAPDNPAVLDTLGWMLVEQGNSKEAAPLLQKASTLAPNAADIRYHFAVALNNTGDKTTARKELEKLLAGKTPFGNIDAAKALLKTL